MDLVISFFISADFLEDRPSKRMIANESELLLREAAQPDALNELAVQVLNRVEDKLTGKSLSRKGI